MIKSKENKLNDLKKLNENTQNAYNEAEAELKNAQKLYEGLCCGLSANEDGSADLQIHMNEESKRFLINYAFLDIIKKAVGQFEEHFNDSIEAIQVTDRPTEFNWSHENGAKIKSDINQSNSKLDKAEE